MPAVEWYKPTERGLEAKIRQKNSEELKKQEMIDIQLLRKNPQEVAKRLATRGAGRVRRSTQFERFETTRKELQSAVQQAQASRNRIAKDIGQAKAKGHDVSELMQQGEKLKSLLESRRSSSRSCRPAFQDLLARIPNIPHESVPVGKSAEDNPRAAPLGDAAGIFLLLPRIMWTSARRSAGSTSPPRPRSPAAASS